MNTSTNAWRYLSESVDDTQQLGEHLGALAKDGLCVLLIGELGAGKTAFTRGFVEGVQDGEGEFVASPTYNVCHIYDTDPPVHHYDLYRIASEDDLESVGFYDSLDDGILIIEWPERVASVRNYADLTLLFQTESDGHRTIQINAVSPQGQDIVQSLQDRLPSLRAIIP